MLTVIACLILFIIIPMEMGYWLVVKNYNGIIASSLALMVFFACGLGYAGNSIDRTNKVCTLCENNYISYSFIQKVADTLNLDLLDVTNDAVRAKQLGWDLETYLKFEKPGISQEEIDLILNNKPVNKYGK